MELGLFSGFPVSYKNLSQIKTFRCDCAWDNSAIKWSKMEAIYVTAFQGDQYYYTCHEMCCLYLYVCCYQVYPFTMLFISQTFIYAHLLCYAPVSSVNTQYYKEVGIYENNLL